MKKAKHTSHAKGMGKKKKAIILSIIILIMTAIAIYLIISNRLFGIGRSEIKLDENLFNVNNLIENTMTNENNVIDENVIEEEEVDDGTIPERMGGYTVLGQIVIDKIGLKKNILAVSTNASIQVSVAKLYGPDLNAPGNFCIDGHNTGSMFKRIHELDAGDTFYMVNRVTGSKVTYMVYSLVDGWDPYDLSCLDQNHDGKREVTIITCTPGGATRVICKAREI